MRKQIRNIMGVGIVVIFIITAISPIIIGLNVQELHYERIDHTCNKYAFYLFDKFTPYYHETRFYSNFTLIALILNVVLDSMGFHLGSRHFQFLN